MHILRAWYNECREATREERISTQLCRALGGALRTMKHFDFRWTCWQTSIVTAFERWRQEGQVVWASLSYKSAQSHPEITETLSQGKEWSGE